MGHSPVPLHELHVGVGKGVEFVSHSTSHAGQRLVLRQNAQLWSPTSSMCSQQE